MRIGTTSFVYRAGWFENARRLARHVDDVELLVLEAERADDVPSASELAALATLQAEHDLSYTVHTPLGASLASEDASRRKRGVESVLRVIDATTRLEPLAFVLHVYLGDVEARPGQSVPRPDDLAAWQERAMCSLQTVIGAGVEPAQIAVESLDYDVALLKPILEHSGVSLALDLGHATRDGRDVDAMLEQHLHRASVVHWHGIDPQQRDHRSLTHVPVAQARRLLSTLLARDYAGVLTIEVFREDDFLDSLRFVRDRLAEVTA